MNAIASPQVTHESETQRQYVRFALPSRAVLEGREYDVKDISSGGIALRGVKGGIPAGKILPLELKLPFDGFTFSLKLDAEVRHFSPEKNVLGCRFVNLGARQTSLLTHVIKSFVAGDVVTSGSILNVASRNNFAKARSTANRNAPPSFRRQLPGLLAVAVLGLLIAAFIGKNLYNSIFLVRAEDAVVSGPSVALRAPSAGLLRIQLDPDLAFVKQNQVIGTLTSAGGVSFNLQSPCNCYIAKSDVASGEMVTAGERLMSLTPVDAKPWIVAAIDPAAGKNINPSATATITVFGSRNEYTGHVVSMESPLADRDGDRRSATLKIQVDQKLPVDFINRLAAVTFAIH